MLCAAAAPAMAQGTRRTPANVDSNIRLFTVRGNVRNALNETGVEQVRVELKRFTGEIVNSTFTKQNGEFEFTGVASGNYLLVAEERDYEPVRENLEVMGASRLGIVLYLRKMTGAPAESGPSVSVRELALPRKTRDSFRKGMTQLYEKKDFPASITQFQKTIAEAPAYYEAYFHLGIAMIEAGQLSEAEQALRKCIELAASDKYVDPYFALASLLSNQNRFDEAEPLARKGLRLNDSLWQGHYELARALMGLRRTDEAEKCATDSISRRSDFAPAYLLLANVNIRKKDYPSLLRNLDEFLRLAPTGPMSAQAREMRERVGREMREMQNTSSVTPPKP
jgi:tetratricopeptide (TPR) repeat protein